MAHDLSQTLPEDLSTVVMHSTESQSSKRSLERDGVERALDEAAHGWRGESADERSARQLRLRQRLHHDLRGSSEPSVWRLALMGSLAAAGGLLLGLLLSRPPEVSVEEWLEEWDRLNDYVEVTTTAGVSPGAFAGRSSGRLATSETRATSGASSLPLAALPAPDLEAREQL